LREKPEPDQPEPQADIHIDLRRISTEIAEIAMAT
jgi:hypothetical protein